MLFIDDVVDDGAAGVFDPNMENVFDNPLRPLRPLFITFAAAADDDENSDDVADEVADEVVVAVTVVVAIKFLLAIGVGAAVTGAEIVGVGAIAVAVVAPVYPLVIVGTPIILVLLSAALAFGNTGVAIDLLTYGVIVLYGAGVWSPNVK